MRFAAVNVRLVDASAGKHADSKERQHVSYTQFGDVQARQDAIDIFGPICVQPAVSESH